MVTLEDIRELPLDEKLQILDWLWTDLTSRDEAVASPSWHEEALRETSRRAGSGEESPIDWSVAKASLRAER